MRGVDRGDDFGGGVAQGQGIPGQAMGEVEERGEGVVPPPPPAPLILRQAQDERREIGAGREVAVNRPPTPPGHEVHRVGNQWYLYVVYRRKENDGKEKRKRKYLGNINGPRT